MKTLLFVALIALAFVLPPPASADTISLGKIPVISNLAGAVITIVKVSVSPLSYPIEQAISGEYKSYPLDLLNDAVVNGTLVTGSHIIAACNPAEWAKNDEVQTRADPYVGTGDIGLSLVNVD